MDKTREELYRNLEAKIGNTPLHEISKIQIPRGNRVFAKEENENPGRSHYDRVFVKLFRIFEERGRIIPGYTPVVETTSGSAGVSFARLARLLNYECVVICPEDLPQSRLNAIKEQGAELRLSPAGLYVDGSAQELAKVFREENKQRKAKGKVPYFGLNHTQEPAATLAASSVEAVVDEAVRQADEQFGIKFDMAIAAGGNGTTLLGFGRRAKRYGFPLVIWESLGSGYYVEKLGGSGTFKWKFGIDPGMGHKVYGTSTWVKTFPLPNIDRAFAEGLVDYVRVLSDEDTRDRSLELVTNDFNRAVLERMVSWEPAIKLLRDIEGKTVGRSSAGNLAMLLDNNWRLKNSNVLIFFYDDLSRY